MRRKIGMLLMAAALLLPAAAQAQLRLPDYRYQPPGFQPMTPGVGIGLGGINGLHMPGIPDIYDPMAGVRKQLEQASQMPGIPDAYDPMARFHNTLNPPRDQFGLPVFGRPIPFPGDSLDRPAGLSDPRFHPEDARPYRMGGPQVPTWQPNNATPPLRPINVSNVDFKPVEVKPSLPSSSSSSGSYWTFGGIATAVAAALCHALGRAVSSSRGSSSRDRE